ncbi:uncharacterized protein LY79DRAFT_575188 [Colletotrichum navitas]|uniref:Uncharacterized protein n=1 Tax=Colletotrichum navitas TaxID=681940 RepID=A0AAD8QBG5_9PEZI|nr:uncharacterized protein LY79DRAFT_575188 [Colletotrichum navitas]KAK1599506.1 hypothetical protein LY79DRAFT_575188 [Colletotrichum navitas]
MGGKVWSVNEERVFWRIIVPQSQKRVATGPAHTKTWEELAPLMQSLMGVNAKRTYTHLGLFEHFFQNIDKARVSPNAGVFVREYQQAVNRILKATEEERADRAKIDGQGDDAASIVNVYQEDDSQDGTSLSCRPSGVTDSVHQCADDFEDEEDDKENRPLDESPGERVRYRAPPLYGSVPEADMGLDNEYDQGIPVKAPPPVERLILEEIRQPHDRGLPANMNSYNEVSEMQIRSPTEYSPYGRAPSRALEHRNNHRVHPYAVVRPQQHGRNPKKGHGRVHSQALQGNNAYCAAPDSHHSSPGYYTPIGFGRHVPPMAYYDYGYHDQNFHPYPEYHDNTQHAPSHPMVFCDHTPGHFHGSYGYEPCHPTLHGFGDSQDWQSPGRNSSAMEANYEISDSLDFSWTSYNGRSYGLIEGDYPSPKSRSSTVHDYDYFTPGNIQRPASSASDSVPQARYRGRHSGSYTESPQVPAAEPKKQLVATRDKEFEPRKTSDWRQA